MKIRLGSMLYGGLTAVALSFSTAVADTSDTLEAECKTQLNLPASACACIGTKAEAELNEKEQAMVVAQVTRNKDKAAEIRTTMTVQEMTNAGSFMASAPGACANQ